MKYILRIYYEEKIQIRIVCKNRRGKMEISKFFKSFSWIRTYNGPIHPEMHRKFLSFLSSTLYSRLKRLLSEEVRTEEKRRHVLCVWLGWAGLGDAEYLSIFDLDILDYQIIRSLSDSRRDTATDRGTTPDNTDWTLLWGRPLPWF